MISKVCLLNCSLIFSAIIAPLAHADWATRVDDDIFTGGHKALMYGTTNSSDSGLLFDCTKNSLDIAYVERDTSSKDLGSYPLNLIIKVDQNPPIKFDAILSRRNDKTLEVSADDAGEIIPVLKSLMNAKSKVLIGLENQDSSNQNSFSADVSNSTAAVSKFIKACDITL